MIIENLYENILLNPVRNGARELFAISGYASATFANKHLLETVDWDIKVNLLIGMPGKRSDHLGYLSLIDHFEDRFKGYYLQGTPPVHCKAYGWFENTTPICGYSGSANYSRPGFFDQEQINQLTNENPEDIRELFLDFLSRSISIEDYVPDEQQSYLSTLEQRETLDASVAPGQIYWEIPEKRVRISFLARGGNLPQRSGLNWGQRPEEGREPNQAYLSLKQDARDEGFLPALAETFTLITDDSKSIDCSVAQQGRKAIHSTFNNSEIGKYVRKRIGVSLGDPVTKDDLESYGRTDYTIEKIDEETFLLDLSVE